MRIRRLAAGLALASFLVAGCGADGKDTSSNPAEPGGTTMDMSRAERRAEELIQQAVRGVSPVPRLESFGGGVKPCLDPSDGGSEDRVTLTRNYWLKDIPREQSKDVVRQVFESWRAGGHAVDAEPDYNRNVAVANLRSKPDDFLMQVAAGLGGQVSVGVTSPCFWPDEVKSPVPKALGHPAPRSNTELQARQQALSGVQGVSSQILDTFAGGRPSYEDAYVWVREQDGSCVAQHQWTYTCGDAVRAAQAFQRMLRKLGERGWQLVDPPEDAAAQGGDAVLALTPDEYEAGATVERERARAVITVSAAWEREWPPPYRR
ncbi:hypothetical protein OG729_37055 [Streptomyces sp. NBC_00210]|uniref:hypothetical protein n=1 Tax=unclassified Streptomyces TaxID=2593676 RepID=UPI0032438188